MLTRRWRREFIVVDDGSKDGTAEWVRDRFPQVRVVTKTTADRRAPGTGVSRNPTLPWCASSMTTTYGSPGNWRFSPRSNVRPSHPDLVFSAITMINERRGHRRVESPGV